MSLANIFLSRIFVAGMFFTSTIMLLALALGFALGFFSGRLRLNRTVMRQEAENALLKEQLEELRSTEALLRMELNEVSLSNTRLETLLEETRKQTSQQHRQFENLMRKTLKTFRTDWTEPAESKPRTAEAVLSHANLSD